MSSASTAVRPVAGTGLPEKAAAALVNSFRLASVTQRLAFHIQTGAKSDVKEFQSCCISLAKGIDFAIANNEIPKKVEDLPSLLKQVCRHRDDVYTKTAVLVLMISIKNDFSQKFKDFVLMAQHACKLGWFSDSEAQELIALADQMKNGFGNPENTIPAIQSPGEWFYPLVKLGHVLVSLEVKSGYTMLAHDFHISKNMPHSPQEKIDSGPQLPTNVTAILKYGTNLLQVMGNSNGHYIIVIAFTGLAQLPEKPVLKEYVQSGVVEASPDSDIIEGPSRVSLRCPISLYYNSRSRIKLPVKGHLCKHLQCFDFWNYVNINMRNPSWRCPHCNQPVSYPEIRLDQNMDAGRNAADVIIHAGGTWKVAMENNGNEEPVRDAIIHDLEDPNSLLNAGPVVLDLTGDDEDDTDIELFGSTSKAVDQKPHLSDAQGQSNNNNTSKDASVDDYCSMFNFSDVISLDEVMLDHLNTGTGQDYSNLSQLPMPRDPTHVPAPFSQAPSPRERSATTSTVFPSPQVHASPVTPGGTYLSRTSSQMSSSTTSSQSRVHPVQVTSQSLGNGSSLAQSPRIPRVLAPQPNSYFARSLNSNHLTTQTQRPSSPPVQSVSRTSDLMDVDSATPDTSNWRPRMRGSITPGSYSPALDHMIIRPTQQSQTRLQVSQPGQTPPVQTSQALPPFSTAPPPTFTRPSGPTAPWGT
ncbi:hypothetical protein YC2023_077329 [Brassica napus]